MLNSPSSLPSPPQNSRRPDLNKEKKLSRKRRDKRHRRPIISALIGCKSDIVETVESQRLTELKEVKANFKLEETKGKYEMVVWPPQPPFFESEIKQGKKVDPNYSLSDKSTVVDIDEEVK